MMMMYPTSSATLYPVSLMSVEWLWMCVMSRCQVTDQLYDKTHQLLSLGHQGPATGQHSALSEDYHS